MAGEPSPSIIFVLATGAAPEGFGRYLPHSTKGAKVTAKPDAAISFKKSLLDVFHIAASWRPIRCKIVMKKI